MNFIWDITLNAEKSGIEREELFFCQAKDYSPWYEQAFSVLNQKKIEDTTVEINAICRFDAIFQGILHPEMTEMQEFRIYIFDLVIHFLCEIDLHQGLTRHEFYVRKLAQEIREGVFGELYAKDYMSFSDELQNHLAALLLSQLKTGSSLFLFRKAIISAFPNGILYQIRENPEQILLYTGRKKTVQLEDKIKFIHHMFLPVNYRIRIFWENHFGMLGADATMYLDKIEIF